METRLSNRCRRSYRCENVTSSGPSATLSFGPRAARSRRPAIEETQMSEYNQEQLTQDVVDAFAKTPDPRLREIMTALVKHVHAFAREVDLKPEEWLAGLQFLTRTGQISTDKRPEFILLSDTLGLSMMVVSLAQARASGKRERRDAGDRGDGRGSVLLAGRARPAARQRHRRRRSGRADALHGPRHRLRRQAAGRRAARRLVGRRRRQVRRAALGRADDEGARALPHRRRGPLLVLVDPPRPTTRCPTTARSAR